MLPSNETSERILTAFLQLTGERGIDATTTRTLAEAAGVNEVTIFRHFKDKATLVRELYRRFGPISRIAAYPLAIDTSSPERAVAGLVECLHLLSDSLRGHPQLLLFGLSESWRFPELKDEFSAAPKAARDFLERALHQTQPVLRPEVDPGITALNLLGHLVLLVTWSAFGYLDLTEEQWNRMLEEPVRLLVRESAAG